MKTVILLLISAQFGAGPNEIETIVPTLKECWSLAATARVLMPLRAVTCESRSLSQAEIDRITSRPNHPYSEYIVPLPKGRRK